MDEYLYLSSEKLRQFLPPRDQQQWWRRLRVRKTAASVGAGPAKLDVELEHRGPEQLAEHQLRRVVDGLDERCAWYEEPVAAGDWVMYEGRLGIHALPDGPAAGAVVFYDVNRPAGARRALLHGSATHLLGGRAPHPADGSRASGSRPAGGFSAGEHVPVVVHAAHDALAPRRNAAPWAALARVLRRDPGAPAPDELGGHVAAVFAAVDASTWYTATAPYVAAVVRVTAVLPASATGVETLLGSPLFVRSVRPC
jgi:hypothetical protein